MKHVSPVRTSLTSFGSLVAGRRFASLGLGLALVAGSVACGGGAEAVPEPQTPPPVPEAASPAAAPAAPAVPTAVVQEPNLVACKFQASSWNGRALKLRTAVGADIFASLGKGAKLTATLAAGKTDTGFFVDSETGAAVVRGYVDSVELPLYAAEPALLRGFAIPTADAELSVREASPDSVTFEFPLDAKVAKAAKGGDKNTKQCAYFSLEKKTFDPLTATGSSSQKRIAIRPGKYDLLLEQNGAAAGSIEVDNKSPLGWLLASSGTKRRIAWPVGNVVVVGWTDAKNVPDSRETVGKDAVTTPPAVTGAEPNTGVATWKKVRCSENVKLWSEVGGKRVQVGHVAANKVFQLGPDQQGVRGVAFPEGELAAGDKARFVIATGDATKCVE